MTMNPRLKLFALVAMLAVSWQAAAATDRIGKVRDVHIAFYGTPPGEQRHQIHGGDPVFQDELVETVEAGWAYVRFEDRSKLRIAGGTSLVLDRFVYDKRARSGEIAVDVTKGLFRFVTGKMDPEGIRFRTPVALIGVRGTDIVILVERRGRTTIWVRKGSVEVTALDSDEKLLVDRYNAVTVSRHGEIDPAPYLVPGNPGLDIGFGPHASVDGGGGDSGGSGGDGQGGGTGH